MSCCSKIWDFGKIDSCGGKLSLGFNAEQEGTYTLRAEFLGTAFIISKVFAIGDPLEFPVDQLNEKFHFIARITAPDKTEVPKVVEGVSYECFAFQTRVNYTIVSN